MLSRQDLGLWTRGALGGFSSVGRRSAVRWRRPFLPGGEEPAMPGFTVTAAAASIAVGLSMGAAATVGVTLALEALADHGVTPAQEQPARPPYLVQYGDR